MPHKNDSTPNQHPKGQKDKGQRKKLSPSQESLEPAAFPGPVPYTMMERFYRYLYYLGIQLLRMKHRRMRKISYKWNSFARSVKKDFFHLWRELRLALWSGWRNLTSPLREMRLHYRELVEELQQEEKHGSQTGRLRFRIAWFLICRFAAAFRWLFHWIAPIAACIGVYLLAKSYAGQTYILRLEYNGEEIGYISDESIFNQAKNAMKGRLAGETDAAPADILPHYELIPRKGEPLLSVDRLTDILIRSSGNELVEADGLYLETSAGSNRMELLGAVTDGAELLHYLDSFKEQFRTTTMRDARIEFLKKIQLKPGLYPVSAVRPVGELKALLSEEERGEAYYTVVAGDTPLRIAEKNGISVADLQAMNPQVNLEVSLFPGDELLVSRSVPKLGVKITATERYRESIEFEIQQETVPSQNVGWTNLKQEGREGIREYTAEVVYVDGQETERNVVDRKVIREPVPQILQVGGNRPLQVVPKTSSGTLPSGTFAWPTSGGRIGPGFMGYYGHTGSDISFSGCYGTPVYASAAGTVVKVQYGTTGYGYHIVVDHGGGIQTLYAHCSELYVSVGQQVSQGQQIGAIGRTGNATGPHLHFEVRNNGTAVDAARYLYN